MARAITRRNLIRATGAAGGLGTLAAAGFAIAAETAAAQPPASPIEPCTIKRRGAGLRGYDRERAFDGFTLFSPLPTTNKTVYLIDMLGNVVHTWNMPYPPGQSGYLTDRGTPF